MPAYVYTLGTYYSKQTTIELPFIKLVLNLCITVLPCLIGMVLSHFFPKLKVIFIKIAKPFTFIVLLTFLCLALVTKFYTFVLLKWYHWIAGRKKQVLINLIKWLAKLIFYLKIIGPLIPWIGYVIGGLVAWICKRPLSQCKTIAIETGIQNVGVAFLIIIINFPVSGIWIYRWKIKIVFFL